MADKNCNDTPKDRQGRKDRATKTTGYTKGSAYGKKGPGGTGQKKDE